MQRSRPWTYLAILAMGACTTTDAARVGNAVPRGQDSFQISEQRPPDAAPNTCWGKAVRPAVIETVTEQSLVQPAQITTDGRVIQPAAYRSETVQRIIQSRQESWFETPCPNMLTGEFIASVQRALQTRGLYRGRITGIMDARTRKAIRAYQEPQGIPSGILALSTARQFGLIQVAR